LYKIYRKRKFFIYYLNSIIFLLYIKGLINYNVSNNFVIIMILPTHVNELIELIQFIYVFVRGLFTYYYILKIFLIDCKDIRIKTTKKSYERVLRILSITSNRII
jgi:hypothetical protein